MELALVVVVAAVEEEKGVPDKDLDAIHNLADSSLHGTKTC